jgi:ATP-independent RNA helicase DbpA
VINVDISRDTEVHIHRIGRTGRAGEKGFALSLAAPADRKWVKFIEEYQNAKAQWHGLDELEITDASPLVPPMVTLNIAGGKREKLRPGDILGALTGEGGLVGAQVGKINVFEMASFVAIERSVAEKAMRRLAGKIKGRNFKMRLI